MTDKFTADALDWDKDGGLLPAIVQDARDARVLMCAYMNRKAVEITQATGWVTFYSRGRKELWTKGETSGNRLKCVGLQADCDADALLVFAEPQGPVCHTGADTCFKGSAPALAFLARLDSLVAERERVRPEGSYSAKLFAGGVSRIAQKVGEEAVETVLAAVSEPDDALLDEAADLVYHLLVMLRARGLTLQDLSTTLRARRHSIASVITNRETSLSDRDK
jgi:phosphoribosyl-ATP pyrophosphohydrolase/phosphoribosyl-AMP cyclohydrolase